MRLLIANSNTSEDVTDMVAGAARRYASPGIALHFATGAFGARVISSRTENAVAQHATVDLVARHAEGCDGVLLATSYDSGLRAARELVDIPVVGLTEASLMAAMMFGTRIGLVVWGRGALSLYLEIIDSYGFGVRICGTRQLDVEPPRDGVRAAALDAAALIASKDLIERDAAEVIVLIGAVLSGRSAGLEAHLPVPILDGMRCGVPMLEAMIRIGARPPRRGSYAAPQGKESVGLSPELTGRLSLGA